MDHRNREPVKLSETKGPLTGEHRRTSFQRPQRITEVRSCALKYRLLLPLQGRDVDERRAEKRRIEDASSLLGCCV